MWYTVKRCCHNITDIYEWIMNISIEKKENGVFMKRKNEKNYIDNIPKINKKWELLEDGLVEITVENTGFFNAIAQKVFKKPRYSFIKLDKYGSCVWQQIDGQRTIYEIGQILKSEYKKTADQLYERLSTFFGILERNQYIIFVNED